MKVTTAYISKQGYFIPDYSQNESQEIVKILEGLGYLKKPYDVTRGNPFKIALQEFQLKNNCLTDGIYGQKTQAALARAMRNLQNHLNLVVGSQFSPNEPFYGAKTVEAVTKFQNDFGVEGTKGIASQGVREALEGYAKAVLQEKNKEQAVKEGCSS